MSHSALIRKRAARTAVALTLVISAIMAGPSGAKAGVDEYLGENFLFAGNFCPAGTLECNGQLLPIAQYSAVFSLLGTTYGGDGQTTFAMPDLRGRVPIHFGQGPGLSNYYQGQKGGTENETLSIAQLPAHNHTASFSQPASSAAATKGSPAGNIPAVGERSLAANTDAAADKAMRGGTVTVGAAGGSQAHNNLQPYLGLRYCMTVEGIYPSQP